MYKSNAGRKTISVILTILAFLLIASEGAGIYYLYQELDNKKNKISELEQSVQEKDVKLKETEAELNQIKENLLSDKFSSTEKIRDFVQQKIDECFETNNCANQERETINFSKFLSLLPIDSDSHIQRPSWGCMLNFNNNGYYVDWGDVNVAEAQNDLIRLTGAVKMKFGDLTLDTEIFPDGVILEGVARVPVYINLTKESEFTTFMSNFESELSQNGIGSTILKQLDSDDPNWIRRVYEIKIPGKKTFWLDITKPSFQDDNENLDVTIDITFDIEQIRVNLD